MDPTENTDSSVYYQTDSPGIAQNMSIEAAVDQAQNSRAQPLYQSQLSHDQQQQQPRPQSAFQSPFQAPFQASTPHQPAHQHQNMQQQSSVYSNRHQNNEFVCQQPSTSQSSFSLVRPLTEFWYLERRSSHIKHNYPTSFVIFHCIVLLLLSLGQLGLQLYVYIDTNNSIVMQYDSGIWPASFLMLTIFFALSAAMCKNYCMIVFTIVCHILAAAISLASAVAIAVNMSYKYNDCLSNNMTCVYSAQRSFDMMCGVVIASGPCVLTCFLYCIYMNSFLSAFKFLNMKQTEEQHQQFFYANPVMVSAANIATNSS